MKYTRAEILKAREDWIEYLMKPHRRKYCGSLANPKRSDERCCIGHATHLFLGLERDSYGEIHYDRNKTTAHPDLMDKLGLWGPSGGAEPYTDLDTPLYDIDKFAGKFNKENEFRDGTDALNSLARVNDWTLTSPQKIGAYLLHVIDGGNHTPFRPLRDYPE